MSSWHSYPSIFALGHRYVADLLLDPVLVQEKVDGSQISFGAFPNDSGYPTVRMRSKGAQINVLAPEKMFKKAVDYVVSIAETLTPGYTYRGEYLSTPKHNALAYDRVPKNHIILFDINPEQEAYLPFNVVQNEAERIGLETVTPLFFGMVESLEQFRSYLEHTSCLGGQKIEGVVVKNYARFGLDKKVLMGKFVSETFKEVHANEWKASNPSANDIVQTLIASLKTPARWNKAVQHLREAGLLEDSPKDIALLMKEVPSDIEKEEQEYIKAKLYEWAWPQIRRGVVAGLPEYYKQLLLVSQFNREV